LLELPPPPCPPLLLLEAELMLSVFSFAADDSPLPCDEPEDAPSDPALEPPPDEPFDDEEVCASRGKIPARNIPASAAAVFAVIGG
jgi:hypothetical protein